jgi:Zn-dependent M16 (insulinase) family peptidase
LFYSSEQFNQYDRLKTLIKGQASAYANSVHESGHTFAVMNAASQYGPVDQMSENLFGLTQVNRMQEIARLENFDDITKKLGQIADHVLVKSSLR